MSILSTLRSMFMEMIVTKEGEAYLEKMAELTNKQVEVGFTDATYENGVSVADVALFNEYGTSTIPPRPFISQALERNKDDISSMMTGYAGVQIAGGADVDDVLAEVGDYIVKCVQDEIDGGSFVPNAPSTIARKGSDQPLVDTGLLRESITYVVRDKETGDDE